MLTPRHKYAFAAIDGILLTLTLIVPHMAFGFSATPLELRGYGFLYFYVFLAFTVLSLSTRCVLAYGAILAATWAAGVFLDRLADASQNQYQRTPRFHWPIGSIAAVISTT